jgi:hypothetical protein
MRNKQEHGQGYFAAFREIAKRIETSLQGVAKEALPIRMYVAGGAALHFHTGARVSIDVDAAFSHRIALPENLRVSYEDDDGSARLLYFDHQYNDTLGLMHEDAYEDSVPLALPDINRRILDVRLLAPVDLAISKLGRYSEQDRADILSLAKKRLLTSASLSKRAQEAIGGYVGDIRRLQGNIDDALRMLATRSKPAARIKK